MQLKFIHELDKIIKSRYIIQQQHVSEQINNSEHAQANRPIQIRPIQVKIFRLILKGAKFLGDNILRVPSLPSSLISRSPCRPVGLLVYNSKTFVNSFSTKHGYTIFFGLYVGQAYNRILIGLYQFKIQLRGYTYLQSVIQLTTRYFNAHFDCVVLYLPLCRLGAILCNKIK